MKCQKMSIVLLSSLVSMSMAAATVPPVFANTSTNLTDLATNASISTKVTGFSDPLFEQQEQAYQAPLTGSEAWHGFSYQGGRDITITLPQTSTVDAMSIDLRQDVGLGVYYPKDVQFEVMHNGTWYQLGTVTNAIPNSDRKDTSQEFLLHFAPVVGQEFRIHFDVGVWVFAREVHVYGTPGSDGSTGFSAALQPVQESGSISSTAMSPSDTRAYGIKNMLLVNASSSDPSTQYSVQDFLPMVGYTDSNGNVKGHMFDTILFLADGTIPQTKSGWESYLNNLFSGGNQLANLDAAVAQQNQALQDPNYMEKVVLTIPYPAYGTQDFGTINGTNINFSGSPTDPDAIQARTEALNWFVTKLLADWNAAHFQHLQLTGLYWQNEQVTMGAPGEKTLIQNAVTLAHENQLPLFWIPFFAAHDALHWQTLGFDAAWLQPNFVEQGDNANASRLSSAMAEAAQSGMGVELELTGIDSENATLYVQSLQQFEQGGFGANVSHAYYDATNYLVQAAQSNNPFTRALYDDTYQFMHQQ